MLNFKKVVLFIFVFFVIGSAGISTPLLAKNIPFTLEDRDRMIKIETTLSEFKKSMERQFGQIDKRFEQIDKRFEQVDRRFEQIDRRFEQIDKRFEQIDKRFEQVDKRFEFIQNLLIGMLAVFGGLCGVFVGLLLWDRKTFKDKAKEEAIKVVEEGRVKDIIGVLNEYANSEPKLKGVLQKFNLL